MCNFVQVNEGLVKRTLGHCDDASWMKLSDVLLIKRSRLFFSVAPFDETADNSVLFDVQRKT